MAKPKKSKLLPPRHNSAQAGFVFERTKAFREDKDIALDKSIRQEEEEMLILARLLRSVANDHERMVEVTKKILSVKSRVDGGHDDDDGGSNSSMGGNNENVVFVARVALQLDPDLDSDFTTSGRTRRHTSSSSRKEYSDLPDLLPPPPPSLTAAAYEALPPISDFPLLSAKSLRILQSHNKGKPTNGSGVKKKRLAGTKSNGGGSSSRRGSLDTDNLGTAHKRRASSTTSSDADFSPSQRETGRGSRNFQRTTRYGRDGVAQGSQDVVVMTSSASDNAAGVANDHATTLTTNTIPGHPPSSTAKHTPAPKSNVKHAASPSKTPPAKRARRDSTIELSSRASVPVSESSSTTAGGTLTDGEMSDLDFEPDTCLQCLRAKTRCHGCQRTRKNTWSRCIRCVRHGVRCDPVVAAVAYALDPTLPPMPPKTPNSAGSVVQNNALEDGSAQDVEAKGTGSSIAAAASAISPSVLSSESTTTPHPDTTGSLDSRKPCINCKSSRVKCEYLNRLDDGSKDLCRRCVKLHLECVSMSQRKATEADPSDVLTPADLVRIKEELLKAGSSSALSDLVPRDRLPAAVVAAAGPLLSNNLSGEDYQIGKKRQLAFPDGISKANILQHRPRRAAATVAAALSTAGSPSAPRTTLATTTRAGRSKSVSGSSADANPHPGHTANTNITTKAVPDTRAKGSKPDGDVDISVLAVTGEADETIPSTRT